MNFWDERYSQPGFAYGTEANDFLVKNASKITRKNVLCLAEGEGRNAVFLAKLGFNVHAIDSSEIGLKKATTYAQEQGVNISTEVADLSQKELQHQHWDGIISISAHMPATARKFLHAQVIKALKPDGIFILEAYTSRQLDLGGIGGPSKDQLDMFMSLDILKNELAGLQFLHAEELEREVNEGHYHRGRSAVVQLIAKKRHDT